MLILQKKSESEQKASEIIQIHIDKQNLEHPTIDNIIIEFELMNPAQVQQTFNAYFNILNPHAPSMF